MCVWCVCVGRTLTDRLKNNEFIKQESRRYNILILIYHHQELRKNCLQPFESLINYLST